MSHQLLRELRDAIKEHLAEMALRDPAIEDETEDGAFRAPRVHLGSLPAKRKQAAQNQDFPFVVIRATSGEDRQDESVVDVQIVCGIYTAEDEEGGVNDLQNLVDRIRALIMARRVFGGAFEVRLPMSWDVGSDEERNQPHPYYVGQLTPQFVAPHQVALPEVAQALESYGAGLEAE